MFIKVINSKVPSHRDSNKVNLMLKLLKSKLSNMNKYFSKIFEILMRKILRLRCLKKIKTDDVHKKIEFFFFLILMQIRTKMKRLMNSFQSQN